MSFWFDFLFFVEFTNKKPTVFHRQFFYCGLGSLFFYTRRNIAIVNFLYHNFTKILNINKKL